MMRRADSAFFFATPFFSYHFASPLPPAAVRRRLFLCHFQPLLHADAIAFFFFFFLFLSPCFSFLYCSSLKMRVYKMRAAVKAYHQRYDVRGRGHACVRG